MIHKKSQKGGYEKPKNAARRKAKFGTRNMVSRYSGAGSRDSSLAHGTPTCCALIHRIIHIIYICMCMHLYIYTQCMPVSVSIHLYQYISRKPQGSQAASAGFDASAGVASQA